MHHARQPAPTDPSRLAEAPRGQRRPSSCHLRVWAHHNAIPNVTNHVEDWAGSSGLFACEIARQQHGRITSLCGVPMDPVGQLMSSAPSRGRPGLPFRRGWERRKEKRNQAFLCARCRDGQQRCLGCLTGCSLPRVDTAVAFRLYPTANRAWLRLPTVLSRSRTANSTYGVGWGRGDYSATIHQFFLKCVFPIHGGPSPLISGIAVYAKDRGLSGGCLGG